MPEAVFATHIEAHELTPLELRQIQVTLELSYTKVDSSKVLIMAMQGDAQLWRIYGAATGVAVTQILQKDLFRELFVWVLAGKNIMPNLHKLMQILQAFAVDCNCKYVHALALPRLANVYVARHGFKLDTVSVYKEVPNGRE